MFVDRLCFCFAVVFFEGKEWGAQTFKRSNNERKLSVLKLARLIVLGKSRFFCF